MTRPRRLTFAVVLAVLAAAARPAFADDPADPLLRLVPPGTGICVVVQELRDHTATVGESPFAAWFAASPLPARLMLDAERERMRRFEEMLRKNLGVTADQLRDDVFGDAVVYAYRPGPPDRPDDESGLLLVHPRKPEVLDGLVGRLNTLQQKSGEVEKVRTATHRGREYTVREKPGEAEYYLLRDGIFAFTRQESAIRAMIDADLSAPPLADGPPPIAAGLRRVSPARPWLAVWVDPRAFDDQLKAEAEATEAPHKRAFLAQFVKLWAACDGLALTARAEGHLELTAAAVFRPDRMPAELAALVTRQEGPSPLWSAIPADALFATAGRVGPTNVLTAADSFVAPAGRTGLQDMVAQNLGPIVGRGRLDGLLAGLGPNWGVWVEPPAADGEHVPAWTVAVQLGSDDPAVPASVVQAVELLMQLGRIAYNQSHTDQIDMQAKTIGTVTVRYLTNDDGFPAGFRPAFGLVGDYLVFASVPDRVAAFRVTPVEPPPTGVAVPVMRVSAKGVRAYLEGHHGPISGALAGWSGQPEPEVRQELQQLAEVLSAFDRIDVTQAAADGVARMTVTVQFVEPLKK